MALDPRASRWFNDRRGIHPETVEAFGIHTEGNDLVFPYPEGLLKRRYSIDPENPFGLEKEGRRFVWKDAEGGPAQAGQVPYLPPDFEPYPHMLLFEGETDMLAAWQAAPEEARRAMVSLSGTGSWKEKYAEELFEEARFVFVVFDRDDPYETPDAAKATETAWQKVRGDLGRKAKRVVLPQGINDVAEFFMKYDWNAFRVLLKNAMQPKRHYKRLDLSKPVPETDWLVEDFLVRGEATAMVADGGVGKSWIANALAMAIVNGDEEFIGLKVRRNGRVLIVDEENAADLVHQRLHALGYDPARHTDLEYIWHAGVDLANEPELLLEEAMDLEPELIVLDSLSRVAIGVEENSNTEMSKLFKTGIVPLARQTGAAVLVIHHTSASGNGRPRGATSIRNAADEVVSIKQAVMKDGTPTGTLNIFPDKPRRELAYISARIEGSMKDGEPVRVVGATEGAPF